ncbi:hypothetical protein CY34DRAFT_804002 [Suillus luteus UH-Slu-Lm8-n1]|uniref:Uncharacterized protein n=1 Tax=Suillus luteus UH-Slu-Lm8-n1 TaxID=930992 RepID=A0A0D0A000_9AGAM|nr:hypothetical protein CY34DRAFT_804002 [Suillus luteus UH-Slu-Lm8-n1]
MFDPGSYYHLSRAFKFILDSSKSFAPVHGSNFWTSGVCSRILSLSPLGYGHTDSCLMQEGNVY